MDPLLEPPAPLTADEEARIAELAKALAPGARVEAEALLEKLQTQLIALRSTEARTAYLAEIGEVANEAADLHRAVIVLWSSETTIAQPGASATARMAISFAQETATQQMTTAARSLGLLLGDAVAVRRVLGATMRWERARLGRKFPKEPLRRARRWMADAERQKAQGRSDPAGIIDSIRINVMLQEAAQEQRKNLLNVVAREQQIAARALDGTTSVLRTLVWRGRLQRLRLATLKFAVWVFWSVVVGVFLLEAFAQGHDGLLWGCAVGVVGLVASKFLIDPRLQRYLERTERLYLVASASQWVMQRLQVVLATSSVENAMERARTVVDAADSPPPAF